MIKSRESNKLEARKSVDLPGFNNALKTFQEAAQRVPAYKDFLKRHRVNSENIKSPEDFRLLPAVTKENYLKQYPLDDMLWDGCTESVRIVSMSSGSSGQSHLWPRGNQSLAESIKLHEDIFLQGFATKDRETLVIIAFAMGTWIGGTYTLGAIQGLADQGHRLVAITPGIDKAAIVNIFKVLAPFFDQIVLMGYPPFVKDVIDSGVEERVRFDLLNLKIVVAGESISEAWRDYVIKHIKGRHPEKTLYSIYGTADAGLLGHENPLSILLRRIADRDRKLFYSLFPGTTVLPTFVHYRPELRYFEQAGEDLIFTANNSLPLIRYQILDRGRVINPVELNDLISPWRGRLPKPLLVYAQQPHLALYYRMDVSTTFYALDIFPENIKRGIEKSKTDAFVTGKFIVKTLYDEHTQEQSLHLYIELKKDVSPLAGIKNRILKSIISNLKDQNSEYNRLYQEIKERADPIIHFMEFGNEDFEIKIKHKWIRR